MSKWTESKGNDRLSRLGKWLERENYYLNARLVNDAVTEIERLSPLETQLEQLRAKIPFLESEVVSGDGMASASYPEQLMWAGGERPKEG